MTDKRWLQHYPPGVPHEIALPADDTLVDLLERSLQGNAGNPAATCGDETLRYADLDRLSRAFAAHLQGRGLQRGDRVALMLPTSLPFLVAMVGVLRAGMVGVTVNPLYTPREVEHQLRDAGAALLVAGETPLAALAEVLPRCGLRGTLQAALGGLQALARELADPGTGAPAAGAAPQACASLADALRDGHARLFTPAAVTPADPAFLQYTGGTTGVSKGAVLTHRAVLASTAQQLPWLLQNLPPNGARIVTPLPLYHVYPLAVAISAIAMGAHNRLVPNPRDMATVIAEMRRAPFEMLIGVNTLFNALVTASELHSVDFSATRLVIGAGASVQAAVARRWEAAGAPAITEAYGLTETSPSATFNPPGRNGALGWPVPSTEVRIVDEAGEDVGIDQPGELLIRGPQLFAGYWQREAETRAAMTADGFFRTGDIVTMDATGVMRIVDRKKDMILVSGFNVYPNEVEAVVAMMPEVLECACIGVPDARSGEVPHVFAVPRTPGLDAARIEAHCRCNLAAYKVPRHITLVDALPKSTVGKILRRELRVQAQPAEGVAAVEVTQ